MEFQTAAEALNAIDHMNNGQVDGQNITVAHVFSRLVLMLIIIVVVVVNCFIVYMSLVCVHPTSRIVYHDCLP